MEFKDLGLPEDILKAVTKLGFTSPSEIQEKAIPILSEGKQDFVGLAQTGTGKTAAYGLPLIRHVDFKDRSTQALILCPTRELCMQISRDLESFSVYQDNPNITAVYGGASISDQIRKLKKGAQIVVATPGRLLDLIERKAVRLKSLQRVVLDEADEMLNMGFKEDIDSILDQTPALKRVWLFSATMPGAVKRIAQNYMQDPVEIVVGQENSVAANIEHRYYMMRERDRLQALKRILDFYPEIYGLIFCRTRRETGQVADKLEKDGYSVAALHGDLSQAQRDAAMKKFREKTVKVLVATDVPARGIDVKDITHVIHYNLPDDMENYTHRSGRTARAGKSGLSLALVNTRETFKIKQVESLLKTGMKQAFIPSAEEICEKQMYALMDRVVSTPVDEEAIDLYWPVFYKKLKNLPAEEIVLKFISMELNAFLDYYKGSSDLNASHDSESSTRGGKPERGEQIKSYRRNLSGPRKSFSINLGEKQNLNKGALLRLVCTETGIDSHQIGRIRIHSSHALFEVDEKVAGSILPAIRQGTYEGKSFEVSNYQGKGPGNQEKGPGNKKGKKKKRQR